MGRQKYPEKLLSRMEIEILTGLHEDTVRKLMKTVWKRDTYMLAGKLAVPVSAYNKWIESCRVPVTAGGTEEPPE